MPAAGVDVSDGYIRHVELTPARGGFVVHKWGAKEIPVDAIRGGEIAKRQDLVTALSTLREETGFHHIHAALPEEKAYLFSTEIPRVTKKEIRGAIELLLEENVPIKPDESVFDYAIIRVPIRDHIDVSVSVLPRAIVESYVALYEEAGMTPLVFIVDAQAVAEAVVPQGDNNTHFIVHVGKTRTTLSIVGQGAVYYTSTVAIGSDTLTATFARELNIDEKEAHDKKWSDGLVGVKKNMELYFSLMSTLSVLRDEMNRLLGYWETGHRGKHNLPDVGDIIFSGSDASIPGFTDYFALAMGKTARLADVWANVPLHANEVPPIPFRESLDFATAIGLALPKTD